MSQFDGVGARIHATLDRLKGWLGHPVGGFGAGLALVVIAVVVFVFGVALLISGYDKAGRPDLPRWHPRRWVAPSLDFYVGLLLIELDGIFYGYAAGSLLLSHDTVPFWVVIWSANGAVLAFLALKHWSSDRKVAT